MARSVKVLITGTLPLGGHKAFLNRVAEYEKKIANGGTVTKIDSTLATPDPVVKIIATSLSQYEVYEFDISHLDPVTADYRATFISVGPNP